MQDGLIVERRIKEKEERRKASGTVPEGQYGDSGHSTYIGGRLFRDVLRYAFFSLSTICSRTEEI